MSSNFYDELPYSCKPQAYTHPNRLATIAAVFGMTPVALENCRVLEIACANGNNTIALAQSLATTQFVGIDLSPVQIEQGQQRIAELGLKNIRLQALDIMDLPEDFGQFDYIIAHGIFSWVAPVVQQRILSICKQHLTTNGIAYISYNTRPGWNTRSTLRDLMLYHTKNMNDTQQKAGRLKALLQFLAMSVGERGDAYSKFILEEFETFKDLPESYLFHEFLETDNNPLYFHEFIAQARQHDLEYLGDVHFHSMLANNFPEAIAKNLQALNQDIVFQEQHMDFLRNRHFRHTLLCHQGTKLTRNVTPATLKSLYVGSPLEFNPEKPTEFSCVRGSINSDNPVIQMAIHCLARAWPNSIAFDDLLQQVRAQLGGETAHDESTLAEIILRCYSIGLMELNFAQQNFVVNLSDKPTASPLARLEAKTGKELTNLRCELLNVENSLGLRILPYLDGTRDQAALVDLMVEWIEKGELQVNFEPHENAPQTDFTLTNEQLRQILSQILVDSLQGIAKAAVLID